MRKGSYNGANNDSMYYSYNGLSHYSSNEKKFVSEYLSRIGFHYNGFWENYGSGSTLSMNSFLGVKYILTSSYDLYSSLNNTSKNTFVNFIEYKPNYFDENTKVYENPYALPFLMVVNSNSGFVSEGTRLEDNKTHWFDHFEYQNQIFKTMVNIKDENGNQKDIFKKADYTINTNIKYRENENGKIYEVLNVGDTITFTVKTDTDNPYYYGFRNINNYLDSFSNKMQLYINNNYTYHFSYYNSGINGLPLKNSNQTIKLRVNEKMTNRSIIEEFYYEDLSILKEYIETIKTQNVKEEKISSNKFTYKVNVLKDNQQLLFTLPYEDNFVIKVDGKEVKSKKSYHIFLGADISKGLHTIEIEYVDKGLKIGSIISAFSLITSSLYIIYYDLINLNINKLLKIKKEETK